MRAVLFDFDYTLADSERGIIECVRFALAGLGLPAASPDAIRATIGLSLEDMLLRLAARNGGCAPEFRRLFISRADQVMVDSTVVYPWVPRTARILRNAGITLGIVSTKRKRRIEEVLTRDGLGDLFAVVVGSDTVPRPKPAPDGLLLALEQLGVVAHDALFVGDSVTDAEAAQRAAVQFAAVLSGATPRDAFSGYPHRAILPDASFLPTLLAPKNHRDTEDAVGHREDKF